MALDDSFSGWPNLTTPEAWPGLTGWPGDDQRVLNVTEGVPGLASNMSEDAGFSRDEALVVWELVTLTAIFLMTVAGNLVVLLLLLGRRKKLTRMCYFILSLCVSDLVTAFFNVLPQLAWEVTYRFRGGGVLCKVVKFGQLLGPYLNSYLLVMTALDRYQVICYPLSNCSWTPRRSKNMIYLAWVMALASCTPQLFVFSFQDVGGGTYDCWASFIKPWGPRAYVTWYALSVFILPLCVLVFAYSCICRTLWTNFRLKQQNDHLPTWQEKRRPRLLVRLRSRASRPTGPQVSTCLHTSQTENTAIPLLHTSTPVTAVNTADRCVTQSTAGAGLRSAKPRAHSTRSISRAKIKTVKLTVTVIFCYVSCSAPFISVQLWHVWDPHAAASPFYNGAAFTILTLLASLNSVVNPWIFVAFNENLTHVLPSLCSCPFGSWWGSSFAAHRHTHQHNNTFRSSDSNRNFRLTVFTTAEADQTQQNIQCESTLSSQKLSPALPRRLSPSLPYTHSPSLPHTQSPSLPHTQSPSLHHPDSPPLPHPDSPSLPHPHSPSLLTKGSPSLSHKHPSIYSSNRS